MQQAHARHPISPPAFIGILFAGYLALSYLQRALYVAWILITAREFPPRVWSALGKGLFFDTGAAFYLFAPVAIILILVPRRFYNKLWFAILVYIFTLFPLLLACCSAIGEIFFFDEFHARFNFIAVDYLVYTTEVVRNVLESYSVWLLAAGIFLPAVALFFSVRWLVRGLAHSQEAKLGHWRTAVLTVVAILCATAVSEDRFLGNEPYWPRELSKNSLFALFSAYRRNSINYKEFYSSLEPSEALRLTRAWLGLEPSPSTTLTPETLFRNIQSKNPERHLNVALVVMESMSARFLSHFGNPQPLTPNLDRLADSGLFFTELYATGTRTVRGLEALMLSLPPTPGQSILRRPESDHIFNLGTVFADHGYHNQFVYGGYAYFDNMKEWFEGNGFEVVDRNVFPSSEIEFANAWGICDENLFTQVLSQQQKIVASGKPFFQVILTTSNHRPYTFPEGRIDIPSHTGREGAIKYSDYAVGKFLESAKTKPWFKDTLFIFVADHDASVAGGSDIPVRDFLIPAIFYNPELMPAQKISKLSSQIDLAPTLLSLLGFKYQSRLLGQDLLHEPKPRALLGTYQKVGLLEPGRLTILAPGASVETQQLDDLFNVKRTSTVIARDASKLDESARSTVGIYQAASELFAQGYLKLLPKSRSE